MADLPTTQSSGPVRTTPVTLDLTINLPFLLTVAGMLAAAATWAADSSARLERLEERTRDVPAITERLARIDERGNSGAESLARIERRLDRIEEATP